MPLDDDTIAQQLDLLATHRRTLTHLLTQAAQYGGEVFAPPQTANGITQARAEIARIKAALRTGGVVVEDEPNDTAPPQVKPVPSQLGSGHVTVQGSIGQASGPIAQNFGEQTNIDTAGGHVIDSGGGDITLTGNIDKRQGTFITVQPPVSLAPALHQLRAPVNDFVGREQEIDQLVEALTNAGGAAAAISGVRGMGGIGKTELAYTVAQRLSEHFPDAQLLIELRGVSSSPLTAEQALQIVIRAFEREARLPDDLGQLKGLYNAALSGKRALILADDAQDAAQVRPLLPPSGCALLVTSRNRFSLPGMMALDLGILPSEEAERLLLEMCPRIGEHAGELAQLCGYLPLALRVSASLLKENDSRDVARYLGQLHTEQLKHLSDPDNVDDSQASVEASLRLSYEALGPVARDVLCQLSVFAVRFNQVAIEMVVSTENDLFETLELLRRRSLLEWDATAGLYGLHDLIREFGSARLKNRRAVYERANRWYNLIFHTTDKEIACWHLLTEDETQRMIRYREELKHLRQRLAAESGTTPADQINDR
jgi:hypothetical protein